MASVKKYRLIIFLLLLFSIAIFVRLEGFNQPLIDAYYFRQAQTATVARHFFEDGINLFRPRLDIFGIGPEQYIILESPLYQAVVAGLSFIFGFSTQLARSVSIFSGLVSALCIYILVFLITKNKLTSSLALIFFLFFPLSIFVQHAVLIESFVLMLHLLSLLVWFFYIRSEKTWLLIFFIPITIFALIGKIIYGPSLLLLLLLFGLIFKRRISYFFKPKILFSFLIIAIGTIYWQETADYLNIQSGNAFHTSKNHADLFGYTGYLSERFVLNTWKSRIQETLGDLTKLSALVSLVGVYVLLGYKKIEKYIWLGWIFIMLLYYLVFFRIQNHIYYFYIVTPIVAVLAAYGLAIIYKNIFRVNKYFGYIFLILFVVSFMYKGYQNSRGYFVLHRDVERKIRIINQYATKPGPMVLVFPIWDWHSVYTFYTGRKAIVLPFNQLIELNNYRKQRYAYIIFQDFGPGLIDQNILKKSSLKLVYEEEGILIAQYY